MTATEKAILLTHAVEEYTHTSGDFAYTINRLNKALGYIHGD